MTILSNESSCGGENLKSLNLHDDEENGKIFHFNEICKNKIIKKMMLVSRLSANIRV